MNLMEHKPKQELYSQDKTEPHMAEADFGEQLYILQLYEIHTQLDQGGGAPLPLDYTSAISFGVYNNCISRLVCITTVFYKDSFSLARLFFLCYQLCLRS